MPDPIRLTYRPYTEIIQLWSVFAKADKDITTSFLDQASAEAFDAAFAKPEPMMVTGRFGTGVMACIEMELDVRLKAKESSCEHTFVYLDLLDVIDLQPFPIVKDGAVAFLPAPVTKDWKDVVVVDIGEATCLFNHRLQAIMEYAGKLHGSKKFIFVGHQVPEGLPTNFIIAEMT